MDTNEKIKAVRTAARMLELPDEFDEKTEKKFKPMVLIVPYGVEGSPMWTFIEHRAAHIVEV